VQSRPRAIKPSRRERSKSWPRAPQKRVKREIEGTDSLTSGQAHTRGPTVVRGLATAGDAARAGDAGDAVRECVLQLPIGLFSECPDTIRAGVTRPSERLLQRISCVKVRDTPRTTQRVPDAVEPDDLAVRRVQERAPELVEPVLRVPQPAGVALGLRQDVLRADGVGFLASTTPTTASSSQSA
jgi:hypothetical protein